MKTEIGLAGVVVFLIGMLAGVGLEQWGLANHPHFFCGPMIAGHTATCPEVMK